MADYRVQINWDKLMKELETQGITQVDFSRMIGRNKSYLYKVKAIKSDIPVQVEALMCKTLGIPEGSLIVPTVKEETPPPQTEGVQSVVTVLENMYKLLNELKDDIEQIKNQQEKTHTKVSANTLQLEKIKDAVQQYAMTDYDRAVEFLKEQLVSGRMDGAELLRRSDAAGYKRSDIMKAKNDIGIKITTVGYGRNSKAVWCLER